MTTLCLRPYLPRILSRSLIVSAFATVGLMSGMVPGLSGHPTLVFSSSVYAQEFPNSQEVTKFADTVLKLNELRLKVQQEIKQLNGGQPVNIDCFKPQTVQQLPNTIRPRALTFCNDSRTIIESNGFTPTRFNQIKVLHDSNPDLQIKVRNELIRLQQ